VAVFVYAAFGGAAVSVHAQNQPAAEGAGPPVLAKTLAPTRGGQRLLVTSNALSGGLDDKYTQNGENMSPPITWSRGPSGTRSYALLVEDSGVDRAEPIAHWVIYDIPVSIRTMPLDVPGDTELENGAKQGKNIRGEAGYIGPKPPAGQTHPYHFHVFALNTRLNLDPAQADRNAVVNAMKGHVLAAGDLVVNYTGK
jgi:Raf kinase inhibitor-like YbhB/YbcL family protein